MFNFSLFPYADFNKVNLDWVTEILAHLAGGVTDEALVKKSDDDYDFEWREIGGGSGGAVNSVNGKTGTVVLNASDVGAIPGPTNPATGAFLVWDGNEWTAQTLSVWQGGNY